MMGYLILMLMTPAYNCFAYEGKGIRNLLHGAPIRFRDVLLAKNLIYAAILIFEIALATTLLSIRIGLPSGPVLAATILALVFAVAGQFTIADWVSLSFPRKLEYGSMRGATFRRLDMDCFRSADPLGRHLQLSFCSQAVGQGTLGCRPKLSSYSRVLGGYFAALDALSGVAEKKKEVLIETLSK